MEVERKKESRVPKMIQAQGRPSSGPAVSEEDQGYMKFVYSKGVIFSKQIGDE